jgi:tetratricopeptide (TPR) repeat protein
LVNQADEMLADVLTPGRWEAEPRALKKFLSSDAFERFLGLYLQAMELDAYEPAYPWNLASALRRLGRADLALGFIGRAVRVAEDLRDEEWANPDAYFVWAETAIHAGQDDLALVAIARATEQAGDDEDAHHHAVRLLTLLAEGRKTRQGPVGGRDMPVVLAIEGTAPGHAPDTAEEFAERTKKAFDRAIKRASTKRTREAEPA